MSIAIHSCVYERLTFILDLHVGHVGGGVQKNILSALLWAPANVGEKHCLVSPERLIASQQLGNLSEHAPDKPA